MVHTVVVGEADVPHAGQLKLPKKSMFDVSLSPGSARSAFSFSGKAFL